MRTWPATVYRLSSTLSLTVTENGRVWLQRNSREPVELSPAETHNLIAALDEHRQPPIERADR